MLVRVAEHFCQWLKYLVLTVNFLVGGTVLFLVVPLLPQELRYILSYAPFTGYAPSDLFDYKNLVLTTLGLAAMIPSIFALCGARWAIALTWIGFAVTCGLILLVYRLLSPFASGSGFKCCGLL